MKNSYPFENKKNVLTRLLNQEFPSVVPERLIAKICFIYALTAFSIMAVCPQFGLSYFKLFDLTQYFMLVSHEFCQIVCGFLFVFSCSLAIYLNLKITELEWLNENKWVFLGLAYCITTGFFWMIAPEINIVSMILWSCGSLCSMILFPIQTIHFE